ncbi:unnamed protein product [Moneuplotes crassus]|uniref:CSC1/OSCA1-like cytosolic domain-containing protein n=1 Tax=Euplotes crassus TaxID=5936 RepID=A0AAD1UU24_EUPCR|nr:unnamed protein product [Moneuplotes crassus]
MSEEEKMESAHQLSISEMINANESRNFRDGIAVRVSQYRTKKKEENLHQREHEILNSIPPNFDIAMLHGRISRVRQMSKYGRLSSDDLVVSQNKIKDGDPYYCPCCHILLKNIDSPKYKLNASVYSLKELGIGLPLYFYFKIMIIIVLCILTVMVTIPTMIINALDSKGDEWVEEDENPNYFAIGAHGKEAENYKVGTNINSIIALNTLGMIIVMTVFLLYSPIITKCKWMENKEEQNIKRANYFTAIVYSISLRTPPEDILKWFQTHHDVPNNAKIVYSFDVREIIKIVKRYKIAKNNKLYLEAYRDMILKSQEDQKEAKPSSNTDKDDKEQHYQPPARVDYGCLCKSWPTLEDTNKKLKNLEAKLSLNNHKNNQYEANFCGIAFVTFNTHKERNDFVEKFKMSSFQRVVNFVKAKIFKCKKLQSDLHYDSKRIKVEPAPDSSDIYWENLGFSKARRLRRTILTYFITIICLGASFGMNLSIGILKDHLEKRAKSSQDSSSFNHIIIMLCINIASSSIVAGMNFSIDKIIRLLSLFERHETYTQFNISVAIKLTFAIFANTGIIPLFVNFSKDNWFTPSGLCTDISFNILALCLIGPILYIFDPVYINKLIKKKLEMRKGIRSKMTQRQVNELFEGEEFDIAQRYSVTLSLAMIVMLYMTINPFISGVAILGCIFQYWVTKIMLLRRHNTPNKLGKGLDQYIRSFLPLMTFLYCFGHFYTIYRLSEGKNYLIYAQFLIPICHIFIPEKLIHCILCIKKEQKKPDASFKERAKDPLDRYDQWKYHYLEESGDQNEDSECSEEDLDLALENMRRQNSGSNKRRFSKPVIDQIQEDEKDREKEPDVYREKLDLSQLIKYGFKDMNKHIVWDPLVEAGFDPMKMRKGNSEGPSLTKRKISKGTTLNPMNFANKGQSINPTAFIRRNQTKDLNSSQMLRDLLSPLSKKKNQKSGLGGNIKIAKNTSEPSKNTQIGPLIQHNEINMSKLSSQNKLSMDKNNSGKTSSHEVKENPKDALMAQIEEEISEEHSSFQSSSDFSSSSNSSDLGISEQDISIHIPEDQQHTLITPVGHLKTDKIGQKDPTTQCSNPDVNNERPSL